MQTSQQSVSTWRLWHGRITTTLLQPACNRFLCTNYCHFRLSVAPTSPVAFSKRPVRIHHGIDSHRLFSAKRSSSWPDMGPNFPVPERKDVPDALWDPDTYSVDTSPLYDFYTNLAEVDTVDTWNTVWTIADKHRSDQGIFLRNLEETFNNDYRPVEVLYSSLPVDFWNIKMWLLVTLIRLGSPGTVVGIAHAALSSGELRNPENTLLFDRLKRIALSGKDPNALTVWALMMAMEGRNPEAVLSSVSQAETAAKSYDYAKWAWKDETVALELKMMFKLGMIGPGTTTNASAKRGTKSRTIEMAEVEHQAVEKANPYAMFWYAMCIPNDDPDPQKELLLGMAAASLRSPHPVRELMKLHGWKSARAYERGEDDEGKFHAQLGKAWDEVLLTDAYSAGQKGEVEFLLSTED